MNSSEQNSLIGLLAITMIAEGMITVSLLWSGAKSGHSPLLLGMVLFAMNIVPFIAQKVVRPFSTAIATTPLKTLIAVRLLGVPIACAGFFLLPATSGLTLVAVASGLAFVTFISQQSIETYMGQLTVSKRMEAGSAARLSQAALQGGVFVGNACAGLIIASWGTQYVFALIAALFTASLVLWRFEEREEPVRQAPQTKLQTLPASNQTAWLSVAAMALLAIQMTGFNYFVPMVYESNTNMSAADYGLVSAAAGVGALLASTVKVRTNILVLFTSVAVAGADAMIVRSTALPLSLIFGLVIGFGFNLARIRVRQLIFEALRSKEQAAIWGGRMTVIFRSTAAIAPLAFGFVLTNSVDITPAWVFATVCGVVMGVLVPAILWCIHRLTSTVPEDRAGLPPLGGPVEL